MLLQPEPQNTKVNGNSVIDVSSMAFINQCWNFPNNILMNDHTFLMWLCVHHVVESSVPTRVLHQPWPVFDGTVKSVNWVPTLYVEIWLKYTTKCAVIKFTLLKGNTGVKRRSLQ